MKKVLPDGHEARITLNTTLIVDRQKVALQVRQQGDDVLIVVPEAIKSVELRTDAPAELEVPAN